MFQTVRNGPKLSLDEVEDLWKCNSAGITLFGKHGIFGRIPWNMLNICTNYCKLSETNPNGLSIILVKFLDHRSDASPEMTCSFQNSWKCFHTVTNGLDIPLYELEDLWKHIIQLIWHYLENRVFDKIP